MKLPAPGPDGMIPAGPPSKLPVIAAPSLCAAGPCRNYHRVESIMDAEDGGHAGVDHVQTTHVCYPTAGIEIELADTPVLRCSRWEPDNEQGRLDALRMSYMKSADGKAFAASMLAYENDQDAAAEAPAAPAEPDAISAIASIAVQAATEPRPLPPVDSIAGKFDDAALDALEDEEIEL